METPRRTVLVAGAAGAAALVAGCSNYGDEGGGSTSATPSTSRPETTQPATSGTGTTSAPPESSAPPAGEELAKTADIPVGGGKVFADQKVVVTQPTSGDFKAFSAICTHQGCTVNKVADGTIDCPCHGSKYNIEDAAVVHGPATRPLPTKQINVSGDTIVLT
ncbi:iron sulfur protein [Streptomyces lunaelactis]|uniref:Cytochrome bc1 complex Rieske iron-sulfur subunit n=1 Tax=Streptomyces lunaelactis TaxID=1535768 RepID=A0A2R4SZC4_9ACTN|nr:Rieske (2Fe-2S) protein [Streptomyces lunaelactis]AVZ72218.1 iron sulfur protein [Streptomyces lunaelactis]NUK04168.1 Rieske (2Fe-2S) protein [Streptomyces lunaelactis]NUK19139.1 Rieske (2Fe-2S) protein [Streptomyces lunaelactis]NUK37376.1 Rieske (2Fe-2S) protein [Streptomyces lunaelactis]NUK44099.1 Rieske (2Fe-2S) protein [Streptomyces lunaelactis]